jgi:hypothetical protein
MKISKKLVVAIVTGILVVCNQGLGLNLPADSIIALVGTACSYILGQSAVDRKLIENGKK